MNWKYNSSPRDIHTRPLKGDSTHKKGLRFMHSSKSMNKVQAEPRFGLNCQVILFLFLFRLRTFFIMYRKYLEIQKTPVDLASVLVTSCRLNFKCKTMLSPFYNLLISPPPMQ